MTLTAVIWDYDGTLMDSCQKNLSVNQEIYAFLKPDVEKCDWPLPLRSIESYRAAVSETLNWLHFYMNHLGLTEKESYQAGRLWSEFNFKNETTSNLFDGISNVIKKLNAIPQGICSLNSALNIRHMLKQNSVEHFFKSIIGFDTDSDLKPKPDPSAFLHCLEDMNINPEGTLFYIGDHHEDIKFSVNAETALKAQGNNVRVLSIAAGYGGANPNLWEVQPNYLANKVEDIVRFIEES